MGKLGTEYFFARRLSSGGSERRNGVMVKVATLSVAIGLCVMIIALSVVSGFKKDISDKISGFMSHVQIKHFDFDNTFDPIPIPQDQPFIDTLTKLKGFVHMNRFAMKPGILKGREAIEGILLKGVGDDYDWSFFQNNLIAGSIPNVNDSIRNKDVLISRSLASKMKLGVGDRFEMLFIQDPPRPDLFKVAGIYDTQLSMEDNIMVITDIRNIQHLNGWDYDQISGFEIMSSDFGRIEKFSDEVLYAMLPMSDSIVGPVKIENLIESNSMMFDWLKTHDMNAAVIITIMLLVAVFNMIAALLIILLEKTSMIGILKALGMTNKSIQNIFIIRSSSIIIKGMLWGDLIGIALCLAQKHWGMVKLNAEGYFLEQVPVNIDPVAIILLNAGVFAAILLFQILPTMIISKITPDRSIRFE